MNTTINNPASNDLRYTINTKDKDGNDMRIKIRLNDECNNGHQDFAITADIWKKGKPKIDKYHIMSGCCHDEILAARPDLKIFVDLHLCDYLGIPMYAIENGFYHLREGFNNTKPDQPEFKPQFCEYYRVTTDQFDILNTSQNQLQYGIKLQSLGILEQWKAQANKAITQLEEWTEKKFLVDSVKTQFNAPTAEQLAEEKTKVESGYYTPEAIEQRRKDAIKEEREKITDSFKKEIEELKTKEAIQLQLFDIGGRIAVSNTIYYPHNKTISFNWQTKYGSADKKPLSDELIHKIKTKMKLPEGVTFAN